MSDILARIQALVGLGAVSASVHGFRELAADDILLDEITTGVRAAIVIEEYPEAFKGPSILVLQRDKDGNPCTSCGEFRKAKAVLRPSSLRIGRIRTAGRLT